MRDPFRALAAVFLRASPAITLTAGIAISAMQFTLFYVYAKSESVLFIKGGIGFLNNAGLLSTLAGNAVLPFLGRVYVTQFFEFAERAHDIKPKPLARNVRETRRMLLLRGRYRFLVYALVFIGALFWCANTGIHVFGDPQLHWGHKVFDSVDHPMNFVLNRVNNFYTWVILLPFVGHIVIFSTIQLVRTTKRASIAGSLQYDLLNPDRRGGFIAIDRLHMILNCLIAILYIQVALHTETFERMNIDHAIAYFSATVFLLCGNSVFFWPIRADVGKLKLAALNRQKCRVYRNEPQSLEVLKFFYELNSRRFEAFSFAIKAFALVVPAVVKAAPFFFGTPSQLILL